MKLDIWLYRKLLFLSLGACFSKVLETFRAKKAVFCLLCLYSRLKFK